MTRRGLEKKKSILQILALAFVLAVSGNVWAQDVANDEEDEAARAVTALDKMAVTGSRIKRTDIEGASPVYVMTSEQIEQEGFVTVFDALATLQQNTGSTQGEAFTNQFTPAAPQLNLRGLGPGRTLILLNGRRAADYPFPFNGQSNFTNLQQIPTAAVERIEILAGGASAVYGSDAVAGVINIITKKQFDGISVTARAGTTTDGAGDSGRVQIVGGLDGDRWSAVYAFEYFKRDPIFGNDRDYLDERSDFPQLEQVNTRSLLYIGDRFGYDWDGDGASYQDPGAAACDAFGDLDYSFRSPGTGQYCGRDSTGDESIRNTRENFSFYGNLSYELNNDTELFASLNYWEGDISSTGFRRWWGSPSVFWNPGDSSPDGDAGWAFLGEQASLGLLQRVFQPSETGEQAAFFEEDSIDIALGVRGMMFDGRYDWEFAYSHSEYNAYQEQFLFKEELIDAYFLGEFNPGKSAFGIPWFDVPADWRERFYTPMTQAQVDALSGKQTNNSDSSNDTVSLVISGELFDMPAGPVGFAVVGEWATQEYQLGPDARTLDQTGNGWWGRSGTGGGGKRDRLAFGAEVSVPVTSTLTLPLAVRWDKYNDDSDVDDALTYNAGIEWRPFRELLIRGTFSTSFRAPDMHFLFAGDSGFFTTQTDWFLCRRDEPDTGPTFTGCQTNSGFSIAGNRSGNINLQEEEGESFTVGFVWEVFDGFSVNVDYYDIELDGIVNDMSIQGLLQDEADCRLGVTVGGTPVDINTVECQRVLARINRVDTPGAPNHENLIDVTVGPINRSFSGQTGIDAGFNYTFDTERAGQFAFTGAYTHVLESQRQEFPEDPVDDQWRDNKQNFEFRSRFRGSAGWDYKDFNTVVTALRTGSVPNWAETARLGDQWTFNLNLAYDITDSFRLSVISTNVTNERPPVDPTFNTWPGFWRGSFNPVGREVWVQADYVFGR